MREFSIKKALGELSIIVLGVLIALFAESAWNDHQSRSVGREYLGRLAAEASENLDLLRQDISWGQYSCTSAKTALALLQVPEEKQEPEAFLHSVVLAALYSNPRYQHATHDDLIGTGGLSLIEDATLRARIVGAYTDFFESLDAWRPPKDGPLRTAVVQTLPGKFIKNVVSDCLEFENGDNGAASIRSCSTTPEAISTVSLSDTLKEMPNLDGFLRERAWQTCEFEEDMSSSKVLLEELIVALDTAVQ